jgi:hypothetical protein
MFTLSYDKHRDFDDVWYTFTISSELLTIDFTPNPIVFKENNPRLFDGGIGSKFTFRTVERDPVSEIELKVVGKQLSVTYSGDVGTVWVNHMLDDSDIYSLKECVRKIVSLLEPDEDDTLF